jgi:hypothetical protein
MLHRCGFILALSLIAWLPRSVDFSLERACSWLERPCRFSGPPAVVLEARRLPGAACLFDPGCNPTAALRPARVNALWHAPTAVVTARLFGPVPARASPFCTTRVCKMVHRSARARPAAK